MAAPKYLGIFVFLSIFGISMFVGIKADNVQLSSSISIIKANLKYKNL